MLHRWEERWEHLQLILEVYQFARDAAVAEAWLMAQDPYLKSEELGVSFLCIALNELFNVGLLTHVTNFLILQQTIDEVENLIKKHEAFEKAAAAQEERFAALERLTTVSCKFLINPNFPFILSALLLLLLLLRMCPSQTNPHLHNLSPD